MARAKLDLIKPEEVNMDEYEVSKRCLLGFYSYKKSTVKSFHNLCNVVFYIAATSYCNTVIQLKDASLCQPMGPFFFF